MIDYPCHFICTDINPSACAATRLTADKANTRLEIVNTDILAGLMDRLSRKVDILICNPPYVATESSELGSSGLQAAWAGGALGLQITSRVVECMRSVLSDDGVAYLVLEQCNKPAHFIASMQESGWKCATVLERRAGRELLSVVKISRQKSS